MVVIRVENYNVRGLLEFAERTYSFDELKALHGEGRPFVEGDLSGKDGQHYLLTHEVTSEEPDLVFRRNGEGRFELTDECYTLIVGKPRGTTIESLDEGIAILADRINRVLANYCSNSNQTPPHTNPS